MNYIKAINVDVELIIRLVHVVLCIHIYAWWTLGVVVEDLGQIFIYPDIFGVSGLPRQKSTLKIMIL